MRKLDQILFHGGQPFSTASIAQWCCDLLIKETGKHYQVLQYLQGQGFYVKTLETQEYPAETIPLKNSEFQPMCYRQALRSWILSVPGLMVGVLIATYPAAIWIMLFKLLQINAIPTWFNLSLLIGVTTTLGLGVIGYIFIKIFWAYYSDRLAVTANGIDRHTGILSRTTTSLRFSDIRSIKISQSFFQRLIGVGVLEFSSAGSDGVDIRFDNLSKPFIIKGSIQRMLS